MASLIDSRLEQREVLHDHLDVIDCQVDEHTSDFRSLVLTDDLSNVLVEDRADLVLVVGVLRDDRCEDLIALEKVALIYGHGRQLLLLCLLLLLHHHLLLLMLEWRLLDGWVGHVRVVAHLLLGSVLVVATAVIRTHVTTLRPTALVVAVLSVGATHARLT